MIYFNLGIENPVKNPKNIFKSFFYRTFSISENKSLEVEYYKFPTLFYLELRLKFFNDPEFEFEIGLFNRNFNIYFFENKNKVWK